MRRKVLIFGVAAVAVIIASVIQILVKKAANGTMVIFAPPAQSVQVRVDGQAPFQLGAGEFRRLRVPHGPHNVVVDAGPSWTIDLPDGLHTKGVPTMAEQCFVELDVTVSHYGKGEQGPPPSVTGRFRQKGPYELPTTYSLSEAELPDHVTEKVRDGKIVGMNLVFLFRTVPCDAGAQYQQL